MAGPTSLDYMPLFHLLDRMRLDEVDWQVMFDGIRIMETESLKAMRDE